MAASEVYQGRLDDEEACKRDGSIYHRSVASFRELLDRCQRSLHDHLWEHFASPANTFARAMHYGVVRSREGRVKSTSPSPSPSPSSTTGIGMHDDLRRAMVSLATAYENVVPSLLEGPADTLRSMLLFSLATWAMDRWLLSNYYRVEVGEDGGEDRRCLDQLAADYEIFLKFTKDLLGTLHQPVEAVLARCTEAVRLLTLPTEERAQLSRSVEGGEDDDLGVISELLQQWHVSNLSVADCERLLSLIKH